MAIKIKFDVDNQVILPTFILSTRSGKLLGKIPNVEPKFKDSMNAASELQFDVYKDDCDINIWKNLKDFKLLWAKEWNSWFEIYVSVNESDSTVKSVQCRSLGESELSQINLYDIEINTEDDISREDYEVTILYDEENHNRSLLHRILDKAPHYTIGYIAPSIKDEQRTFSFDGSSVYTALQDIAEEINCIFTIDCYSNKDGNIIREINGYDLESYCYDCGNRDEFDRECNKCGSINVTHGYGADTEIFISTKNLADSITFETEEGSVKNCFRLEAGDDYMTDIIASCNPNGSRYIWYISDDLKEDMSDELVKKINAYEREYKYYRDEYLSEIPEDLLSKYNSIIAKYQEYTDKYKKVSNPISGFSNLMTEIYDVMDIKLFLESTLMPNVVIPETTAETEATKLTTESLTGCAIENIDTCSLTTATSAVKSMAETIVDPRYKLKITDDVYDKESKVWGGVFTITSYSDDEDTYTTGKIENILLSEDRELFVNQKIDRLLGKKSAEITDISGLFDLDNTSIGDFEGELKKYSLSRLRAFYDSCQACLDILTGEQSASSTDATSDEDLYANIYTPYYTRLKSIQAEITVRENEIDTLESVETELTKIRAKIQEALNMENYLGDGFWLELSAYRREDTYSNSNYVSDGIDSDNNKLLAQALEFIEKAQKDIYKSATLQHSISTSLKNLLVMKEFRPIVDKFAVGNWLRIGTNDMVYRLRLIEYELDFSGLENISVTFSDVKNTMDGLSDIASIQEQAASIATTYDMVARQASQGRKGNKQLEDWVNKGMALTKMKIVDNIENQNVTMDSHGLSCKEYLPFNDEYSKEQLKVINKGIYITDDNWETSRAAVGNFYYIDPIDNLTKKGYGVIADTIVGNIVLSKDVSVYNFNNSIRLNDNGLVITSQQSDDGEELFVIQKITEDDGQTSVKKLLYIDSNGELVLDGSIKIANSNPNATDACSINKYLNFTTNDGLKIGDEEGSYIVVNGKIIGFKSNIAGELATISGTQLDISQAEIKDKLRIGNFSFVPSDSGEGGISLVYEDDFIYTVEFVTDNGVEPTKIEILSDDFNTIHIFNGISTPMKEGYVFNSWAYNGTIITDTESVTYGSLVGEDKEILSVKIVAQWADDTSATDDNS